MTSGEKTIRVDESVDRAGTIGPCKNVAAYRTVALATNCNEGAKAFCDQRWAPVFLPKDEQEEKFRAHFLPFWSFFMAMCRAVEIGDNELLARDGFFLGLIDVLRPDLAALLAS
jgi:hypothetical protein